MTIDTSATKEILKIKFITIKQSFIDFSEALV